ncbi:GGDEF domain-containing protein [Cellulomonas denverensis]|uniref:Diguanylate cyclase n=1 Tax=Cellulomonas denverensis TaxID=264297 RepID=A0A7X6QZG0_9CELL|nr:sensor domain-containing diguanylate cyclase [Cellulomonas denverensis]NKY23153.1 diguanylate cyclase [Cellulomonas denverensis]GIG23765.1 hypothetical protein Cde04nite_00090 [Cellulomonas denverensis]
MTSLRAASSAQATPTVIRLLTHMPSWLRVGGNAAAVGRLLLVFCATVIALTMGLLGLRPAELAAIGIMIGVLMLGAAGSFLVDWQHGSRLTVLFPLLVLVALTVIGMATEHAARAYVGLIPLCFVYLGLFHPGRVAVGVVPVALAAYTVMVPVFDPRAGVRLIIYGLIWWGIAQILALTTAYQRDALNRLRRDARTDVLTALGNRRDLEEHLAGVQGGDTLVVIDLDHFKQVNDTLGHSAGDAVLTGFGHLLDQHLRRRDYAARYGGEEFVLVLPRTEAVQAMNMLRALRTEWAEVGTEVTFSAGIATVCPGVPPGTALAAADVALYRAKAAGRDRFRIATDHRGPSREPVETPR